MAKKGSKKQQQAPRRQRQVTRRVAPVSGVLTAPSAIGNTLRGVSPEVVATPGGVRVRGRDFAMTSQANGAQTGWLPLCGMPLTPAAMSSTTMGQYCRMYSDFKLNVVAVHYITTAPTSSAGEVVVYFHKNRSDPNPNFSSTSFLPFLMSDSTTVMGPQWTNHTALYRPDPCWYPTTYLDADMTVSSPGEVWLYSKSPATVSPGFILMDYDIEFRGHQINPRATLFPIPRMQYTQVNLGYASIAVVAGTTQSSGQLIGNTIAGAASALPSGLVVGDVYRAVLNLSASVLATVDATNLWRIPGTSTNITVTDGFTFYIRCVDTTTLLFSPNFQDAITSSANGYLAGVTGTIGYQLQVWMALVGSFGVPAQSAI